MSKRTSTATKPAEPSLRQRAARLRDAAGRFIRRPAEEGVRTEPSPCSAAATVEQPHPVQAEALALVEAFEREWAPFAEIDRCDRPERTPAEEALYEAAYARRSALIDAADALPATCRAARHAKALALAWLTAVQVSRHDRREDLGIDERLALDIDVALAAGAISPVVELSDLAKACHARVERLTWLDVPANTEGMSEEEWDAELGAWGADFRRAIEEPSAGAADMAAKATLMLDDLDRFHPVESYNTDNWKLMRVILREAIAMGGAVAPVTDPHPAAVPELLRLWAEHKRTEFGWSCPNFSPEDLAAAGAHNDLVEGCMEVLRLPPPRTPKGLAAVALAAAMGFEKTVCPDDDEVEHAFGHLVQATVSATGAALPNDYTSIFYRHDAGAET